MMRFIYRDKNRVDFFNSEHLLIGWFERLRVGRFMQWCQFLDDKCYLTSGCSDEVRDMQRKLNAKAKAGINEDSSIEGLEE